MCYLEGWQVNITDHFATGQCLTVLFLVTDLLET